MKKIIKLSFVLTLALSQMLFADAGSLSGIITSKTTGEPIPDANITVLGSKAGTSSRDGGFYHLTLEQGEYQIRVSVIGYEVIIKKVTVGRSTNLNFVLEPKVIEYDPVVVTATMSDHLKSNITMNAAILTRAHMQELKGVTAGEILESVNGVYVKSSDGISGVNTPSIRGSSAGQVLVLLDGIRLNTAQGGGVDLNGIPLTGIERVEVIKGGHSALLGSDAVGGTINLITKSSIGEKVFNYGLNTTIGSFNTKIYNFHAEHKIGPVSIFAGYNQTGSDGDFTYKEPVKGDKVKRINNDSKTSSIFVKTNIDFNAAHNLQVVYHNFDTKKGIAGNVNLNPFSGKPMTSPKARSRNKRQALKVTGKHQISNNFLVKESVSLHSNEYNFINPEGWSPVDDTHENKSLNAKVSGLYTFNRSMTAQIGAVYQKDNLTSTKFKNVKDRILTSFFGQVEYKKLFKTGHLLVVPAVRNDSYSDVGSHLSPKLGLMYITGSEANLAIKTNIASSYRVPTFNDLYWPAGTYTAGNPDLLPETGRNFDFGLVLSGDKNGLVQVEATYFANKIKNLISWQAGSDYIWRPENVGKASITGIETGIKFRHPANKAHINLFYTYMNAIEETAGSANKGKTLIYRPDHKVDINAGFTLGSVQTNINYRVVSRSFINATNAASLPGYQLLNANLKTRLNLFGFKFNFKIQGINLMNKMIFLSDGYPLPGREFRCTVGVDY